MRLTKSQIDEIGAKLAADRAALEASMTPEGLLAHDLAEAAMPDIFDLLAAEQHFETMTFVGLDECEARTLQSLGAEGVDYLMNIQPSDYEPFDIDDPLGTGKTVDRA